MMRAEYLMQPTALLAAVGFVRFAVRTRFWLPRYVHVMAAVALAIGIWFVTIVPATGLLLE
jgi:hypothetical protein